MRNRIGDIAFFLQAYPQEENVMVHDNDPEKNDPDPDIGGIKLFIGGIVAIMLVMTGIYLFANMHAVKVASNSSSPPVSSPAPEPSTPPPSTMSR